MQKIFTNLVAASLMLGAISATAQNQIWPTTDSITLNASQFKGAGSLFTITRTDSVVPATHTGWYTKGLTSANAAKADSSVWKWNTNGVSLGAYGGTAMVSPTVANGAVTFDSDWLDNKGVGLPAGDGIGQSPSPHSGEIVSPIMDARGYNGITLRFNQLFRNYAAFAYVTWSEDSGRTWKPRIRVNADITANNATAVNAVANVKLTGSVGTSGFRIKFIFDGDYYFWSIDDVKLISVTNDLKVNTFFAIAPNYITQKNQVEDMKFLLDIANAGNTMSGVKVKLFVYRVDAGPVLTTIYTDSLSYGTVRNDTTIENKLLPGKLLASSLTPGQYYGRYRIAGDSIDQNPANDTLGFGFFVSDSLYWKESASISVTRPSDAYWATATEPRAWRTGNYFYIKKGSTETVTSLTVRLGDPSLIKGQRVSAGLYEWVDANSDKAVQASERTLVAFGDTLIPATQPAGNIWLTLGLKDINTQKWFYPGNNKEYLAMMEFDPTNATMHMTIGFNRGLHDYGATIYMQDSLYRAGVAGFKPRYAPILGKKSDTDWSTVGFGQGVIPTVRMTLLPWRVKDETLSIDHKIEIFPNPAKETVTVSVDLPHAVIGMAVQVLDNNGRLIQEQLFNNVQKDNYSLNIENLASGSYMLRILTPDGTRMKKLVVAK
jgi:Secretion system C-terminal sorting domain